MSERPNDTPDTEAIGATEPDGPMPEAAAPEPEAPEVEGAAPEPEPAPEPGAEPELEAGAEVDTGEGAAEIGEDAMDTDAADDHAADDLEADLEADLEPEPEPEPAAPIRPLTPAERRAARAGLSHGQIPIDPSLRIKDRASAIFVLVTVGVFLAIFLNAIVLGHGGFLTPLPTPTPVPSITAAPSATPAPSATVAPTPAATPTTAPTGTPAPS